jgi:hypothetical protein
MAKYITEDHSILEFSSRFCGPHIFQEGVAPLKVECSFVKENETPECEMPMAAKAAMGILLLNPTHAG